MFELTWLVYAAAFVGIVAFSYALVKLFTDDSEESESLPTLACTSGLVFALLAVFLIPIDIYSVAHKTGDAGEVEDRGEIIKILYYTMFSGMIFVAFALGPFAYFYYEEMDPNSSNTARTLSALRYTVATLIIVTILLVTGLFVRVGDDKIDKDDRQWMDDLFDTENAGDAAITFAVAVLALIGHLGLITYTAYGFSAMPLSLIRSKKSSDLDDDLATVTADLSTVQGRIRDLRAKKQGGSRMGLADRKQLEACEREERVLRNRESRLAVAHQSQNSWFSKLSRPFKLVMGLVLFAVSILIVVSLIITTIDKGMNSICGVSCGFVLDEPTLPNPLDITLVHLSGYFPADYIFLGVVIFHIFISTIYGLVRIGIRLLFIHLYSIRVRASVPQGLIMATIVLMFAITAVAMNLTTLAPQYSTYGTQKFYSNITNAEEDCTVSDEDVDGQCYMTQLATFINRVSVSTSFFAIVFFAANCAFAAFFVLGFFVALCSPQEPLSSSAADDDDDAGYSRTQERTRLISKPSTSSRYQPSGSSGSSGSSSSSSGGGGMSSFASLGPSGSTFDINSPRPYQPPPARHSSAGRPATATTSKTDDIFTLKR